MNLSPLPVQKFFDNNGRPLVSGRLFTYVAGTSTKIATYTDSTGGATNTNPVVLDFRGEANVWLNPSLTYKFVLAPPGVDDPPTSTIWTVDNITNDVLAQIALIPPWAKTRTEVLAGANPTAYAFLPMPEDVRRYGADDAGVDAITSIQDTVDSQNAGTIKGGAIWFPGDANSVYAISATIDIPDRSSGDNHSRWYSLAGMGRGAPRITAQTGLIDGPMINMTGQDAATYSFYREVKDMYLNGAGIAQRGVEMFYNQHFKIENVFITGLDNGTSPSGGAGIRVYGAICAQFRDVKVHNIEGNGINAYTDSGNFFNANLIAGCSFLDVTINGMYVAGGGGNAWVGNTFEFCDEYGLRFSGFSGTCGLVGGNYLESNGLGDLLIGEDTQANALFVCGNYLNGYGAGVSATTYTPIRVKFADGPVIIGNMVALDVQSATGYRLFDANISGGSVENTIVHYNQVRGLASNSSPRTVYNLPTTWVDFRNSCIDQEFVPLVCSNLIRRGWHSAGWTLSTSGTGTAVVSSSRPLMGATSIRLVRPAASTSSASQTFALETGSPYKNRFVTLSVPIRANVGSSSLLIDVTPDGTSPQTASYNISSLAANEERIVYVMVFVPSDATQIAVAFTANATSADFDIGMPCLYVGATQWYSSYSEGDTEGTWTPIIGGSGGQSGQTYSSQVGKYIRIGGMVFCSFDVTLSNKGTITSSVVIKGLPMAGLSTSLVGLAAMPIGFFSNLATNWVSLGGYVEGQNSQCFVTGLTAAAASASFLVTADIGNTTRLSGSFCYAVNQP